MCGGKAPTCQNALHRASGQKRTPAEHRAHVTLMGAKGRGKWCSTGGCTLKDNYCSLLAGEQRQYSQPEKKAERGREAGQRAKQGQKGRSKNARLIQQSACSIAKKRREASTKQFPCNVYGTCALVIHIRPGFVQFCLGVCKV